MDGREFSDPSRAPPGVLFVTRATRSSLEINCSLTPLDYWSALWFMNGDRIVARPGPYNHYDPHIRIHVGCSRKLLSMKFTLNDRVAQSGNTGKRQEKIVKSPSFQGSHSQGKPRNVRVYLSQEKPGTVEENDEDVGEKSSTHLHWLSRWGLTYWITNFALKRFLTVFLKICVWKIWEMSGNFIILVLQPPWTTDLSS